MNGISWVPAPTILEERAFVIANVRTATLVVVLSSLLALASSTQAPASQAKSPSNPVVRDCVLHSELTRHYSLAQLHIAMRQMPRAVALYSLCQVSIKSAVAALSGPAGKDTLSGIVTDCASHQGALSHRYKLSTLRQAKTHLPRAVAHYTTCRSGIDSQISALAR